MTKPLILCGAGGHGRAVLDLVPRHRVRAFIDEACPQTQVDGVPVLRALGELPRSVVDICEFLVTIGDNEIRARVMTDLIRDHGVLISTALVHRAAYVSQAASVHSGSVVFPQATIGPDVWIGRGVIVNNGARIPHGCVVEDFASISDGAILGGNVAVRHRAFIGLGAIVKPGLVIGARAIVGMGAVVTKSIPDGEVWLGNPAKFHRRQAASD